MESIQLIMGDGKFNTQGFNDFVNSSKLSGCGLSYNVVSIIGPQSSAGKSTLMNYLFATEFKTMNAYEGMSQTTKGIWLAKCKSIVEPFTIVMDLEGTDGRERGEDDTKFEKQSCLFALAVSDVVMINMFCSDIGREHGGSKPLLRIAFQLMMGLFSPSKKTLLIVLRDKTQVPVDKLVQDVKNDIYKVEVRALAHYEYCNDQFKIQVNKLRDEFSSPVAPGVFEGYKKTKIPASGFSYSLQEIWKKIQENKDLDIPAHKVLVSTFRCVTIAKELSKSFARDQRWVALEKDVKRGSKCPFAKEVNSIIEGYLSIYSKDTIDFDGSIKAEEEQRLQSKISEIVQPVYREMLSQQRASIMSEYEKLIKGALKGWKYPREKLEALAEDCVNHFDDSCEVVEINNGEVIRLDMRQRLQNDYNSYIEELRKEIKARKKGLWKKLLRLINVGPLLLMGDISSIADILMEVTKTICDLPGVLELLQHSESS